MLSRTLLLCVILALISLSVASKCKGRKVVTFNTGLTPRIPNYEKRLELIPKALLKTKADVLCLQEVWFGRDIEAILKVLRKRYSYAYSPLDNGPKRLRKRKRGKTATDAACQNDNTTSLLNCVGLCLQVPAETQEACFLSNCLATIFTLSQNCRSCVTFALRDQQIFEDLCFKSTNNPINQEGLLIVSKRKIMKAETTRYLDRNIKQLIPRSYIEAEIKGIGNFFCTHLTSGLRVPYFEVFIKAATGIDSWEKQQLNEILTLRTRLAKVSDFVVAGDMNNGPAGNAFAAELPQNYAILAAGYVNNYLSSGDPQCTFCVSNNLNVSPLDIVIDHVLLKGRRAKSSKRILGTFGPQKVQLSDHHGVETIVCA